jgi:type II secretory pathway pseudopilin PulG
MLEMVASIVITGIIAVTVLPLINGAVDAQSKAAAVRVETENLAFAMERMVRTLRDAPEGTTNGTVGITSASTSSIALSDGRQFSLGSGEVTMRAGGTSATLCRGVTALEFNPPARSPSRLSPTPGARTPLPISEPLRSLQF